MNGLIFDDATCEMIAPPPCRERDYLRVEQVWIPTKPRVTVRAIQQAVCAHYGLQLGDMVSSAKPNVIARPRQLAMYLSRKLVSRSYPEIGRAFGGRDHTTALHAFRKVQERLEADPDILADHDTIVEALSA